MVSLKTLQKIREDLKDDHVSVWLVSALISRQLKIDGAVLHDVDMVKRCLSDETPGYDDSIREDGYWRHRPVYFEAQQDGAVLVELCSTGERLMVPREEVTERN